MDATNPPQQPEPSWAQGQSASRRKMYILAGGAALLLAIVALAALFRIMRPEPPAKSSGSGFTQRLPRAEPLSAPQEAVSVSREPDSHMFLPGDEPAEGPAPAAKPPAPAAQASEPEPEPGPPPMRAARESGSKPGSGGQRRGAKLAPRDFNSGNGGGSGGFGSFGGGNLGGSNLAAPALNVSPARDLSVAERLGTTPASKGAAADASGQALKRSINKKGTGSGHQKVFDKVAPFSKDPKGERTSDEAGGVKPGWVRLDDGSVIYVLEMSGSVSEQGAASGGSSGGGTVGGGEGSTALENAVKAGGGQAVVGGR